jgi:hypothetical protein
LASIWKAREAICSWPALISSQLDFLSASILRARAGTHIHTNNFGCSVSVCRDNVTTAVESIWLFTLNIFSRNQGAM